MGYINTLFIWKMRIITQKKMSMATKESPFVVIKPDGRQVHIVWGFTTYRRKEEGKLSCYIPAFDIYFSAKDEEVMQQKSRALTNMYISHFANDGKTGLKKLVMQLHKLGFKAPNDALTMKRIMNNELVNAKFSHKLPSPSNFSESEAVSNHSELEVAF